MVSVLAAILAIGATGSATRTLEVEDSIAGVVGQVIVGWVRDVALDNVRSVRETAIHNDSLHAWNLQGVRLTIDGQPRAGIVAWGTAAWRVAGYVVDCRREGSVDYRYRLRVREYEVVRHTEIRDGSVRLTTDVWGAIGPRGELYHVRLVLDGHELGERTRLRGTATGWSRIGDRCRLVRRIAEREIGRAMSEVLLRIEAGGTGLYHAGSAESLIEVIARNR